MDLGQGRASTRLPNRWRKFARLAVAPAWCHMSTARAGSSQPQRAPSSGTARGAVVVDLDVVAKALGRDAEITRKVEQAPENLNAQLIQAAQEMEKQLQQQKTDLGDTPSPEAREEFRQTELRAAQNIRNNKVRGEQTRQSVRDEQIPKFRGEVKPIAGRVAKDRGAQVVLIANQTVVWFEPVADITADIIAAMRASLTSPLAPPESAVVPSTTNATAARTNAVTAAP